MKKTVCELFAGVGGFRCGLNNIRTVEDYGKEEKWDTVWFSQWEPAEKSTQYAHDCYVYRFGTRLDNNGEDTTNYNIEDVDKTTLPDFNLLVGGFPCQDYSVASSLATSKGLEGYTVEWRVINAAEYGYQQRRRRTFIFAYKNNTKYAERILNTIGYTDALEEERKQECMENVVLKEGFFAETFPVNKAESVKMKIKKLPVEVGEVSDTFQCAFENSGIMKNGIIYTMKTAPDYHGKQITLGDVMEIGQVEEQYFIPEEKLYYTDPTVTHSDETEQRLPKEDRQTWQYLKGAKKLLRTSSTGHEYVFSEGSISMIDQEDKPARTMLTSEGGFSRTTHIVKDKMTGRVRLLTATEAERIQGFPTDHTKYCLVKGETVEMPLRKRRFMMGNALVVNLVTDMEKTLDKIFDCE